MKIGDIGGRADLVGMALQTVDDARLPFGQHPVFPVDEDGYLAAVDAVELGIAMKVQAEAVRRVAFRLEAGGIVALALVLDLPLFFIPRIFPSHASPPKNIVRILCARAKASAAYSAKDRAR